MKRVDNQRYFTVSFKWHIVLLLKVLVLLLIRAPTALAALEEGLVGYWNLDTVDINWEAKTVLDRSGKGNVGVLVGHSYLTHSSPGKLGQALRFTGSEEIKIPASQLLNHRIGNAYSYSAWLNLTSIPKSWVSLFYKDVHQQLSLSEGLILLRSGAELNQLLKYGSPINSTGKWYHLSVTFDGVNQRLYVNGSQIASNSSNGRAGGISTLKIGGGATGFEGLLDELRVYDRALTPDEVLTLYKAASFDVNPLPIPSVPTGLRVTEKNSSYIKLAWSNSDTSVNLFRLYGNDSLIAELEGNASSFEVKNLKPNTSYSFQISALSVEMRESSRSSALSVWTNPVAVFQVKPAEYLMSLTRPTFKAGHSLLPLTKWSWPFAYETTVEMAHWGYALDFGDANDQNVGNLEDSDSIQAKLTKLVLEKPEVYRLSVNIPRIPVDQVPATAFTADESGNSTKVWSPEAPDEVLASLATIVTGYLKIVAERAPVEIILNGGERYLGVAGHDRSAWAADPKVLEAKGDMSWLEYISKRKAHQELLFANSLRSLTDATYIWYYAGGNQRRGQHDSFWYDWDWDYQWMSSVVDYPSNEFYWGHGNSGWVADDDKSDMLSQALNAFGYAITFGQPLAYNWVNAGWLRSVLTEPGKGLGDIERYYGFLKSAYMVGMIGAVAGYFEFPAEGFDPTFSSNDPPHWLEQIEALGQVHAEFTYLEEFLRQGDLLPGPSTNEKNPDQPAYEFYCGHTNTRVLVRKLRGVKRWLISAWAADGVVRTVPVTISGLGTVKVQAYPAGSLYHAWLVSDQPVVTALDLGERAASPLQLSRIDQIEAPTHLRVKAP